MHVVLLATAVRQNVQMTVYPLEKRKWGLKLAKMPQKKVKDSLLQKIGNVQSVAM